jgi:hypothetical protein
MFFADKLTFGQIQKSSDGYMKVRCRSGRAGIYQYLGREVDPEGKHFAADQVVNVYRSPEEVFDQQHLASFVGKPITIDHPAEPVTAGNWRTHAAGMIMGAVRDGEHIGFDLAFMDSASIQTVEAGKRELSNGYASKIVIGDGVAPDGQKYQARQVAMRGNHCAVVDQGRAGGTCRIGDAAICEPLPSDEVKALLGDGQTYSDSPTGDKNPSTNVERLSGDIQMPHTLVIDGLQVPNVSDEAKAAIEKLQGQITGLTSDKAALETKVGEHVATIATKDGEIAGLNAKLKDAEVTPDKLQKLADARQAVIDKAKAIDPKVVTDGKTEAEIRAAVVSAKLGDAAPTDENGIAGAFAALTADVKPADPLRATLKDGIKPAAPVGREGVDKARAAWLADKENGHRGPSIEVEA